MNLEQHPELSRLSPSEKLMLVTGLWDDLAAHPGQIPVTDEVITQLDRRMEQHRKDPAAVSTCEEVQLRILGHIQPPG